MLQILFEYFDLHVLLSLFFRRFSLLLEEEIKRSTDRIVINIREVIFFNVLLTEHLRIILVINQFDAQILVL